MSEVDARTPPSRGRSSTRGGRGGYSRGGPRPTHRSTNGTSTDAVQIDDPPEDEGELGDMKKQYSAQLSFMKDMFPDWTDVDLVFALAETDGDLQTTIDRITQGNVSQFADVKKKTKDRARSKAKDSAATGPGDQFNAPLRGARGRGGFEGSRGGRARGADRGRGGFRGARGGHSATDGVPKDTGAVSVPTTESSAWDTPAQAPEVSASTDSASAAAQPMSSESPSDQSAWGNAADATPAAASESAKSALIPEGGPKKTWASMFALPKIPDIIEAAAAAVSLPLPAALTASEEQNVPEEHEPEAVQEPEPLPPSPAVELPAEVDEVPAASPLPELDQETSKPTEAEANLAPSTLALTVDNLESLPDSSHPPATLTAASTVGSLDPRGITPIGSSQQPPIGRPPIGGYAASAYRAAGTPGRSASFQRRILEQQEAVVMPGYNAVDRAAVQFGSMGLNGDAESLDVDEEREEPETRTQPPQQSPPSQPRASLPPAPRQQTLSHELSVPETLPTPKQAPGLPPAPQQALTAQHESSPISSLVQEPSHQGQAYGQYARYTQAGMQPEPTPQSQKSFDPFSHQAPSSAFDQYVSQPSAQQHQQGFAAFSSAPSEYSHYYTADQQRNAAYQSYYGASYGQQNNQSQDSAPAQQRSSSGFGSAPIDSSFSVGQGPQQSQSRYGETPSSDLNAPNPSMGSQQQSSAPSQQMHQQAQLQSQYPGYPYGHPYYNSPYHAAYQNQFGFSGYGQPYTKGGMYGQPHGYGMNPPSSYDHSSSPATAGGFGTSSMQSRESGLSSGLGDYGRSSTQPSQLSSSGFGGMSEPFGRTQSGFQGQSQSYVQGQSMQPTGSTDDLKPFGDSKVGGPSPALGQPGRPGSAANSVGGQAPSSTLPPPQSHQQGFGGYPGFNQGSQYGGLGGLGGQSHQQGGYGGYGGFGNSYGNYGRGGWGGNYGGH